MTINFLDLILPRVPEIFLSSYIDKYQKYILDLKKNYTSNLRLERFYSNPSNPPFRVSYKGTLCFNVS
jgi:hypothetical protein